MSEFVKLSPEERNLYCRQASERMSVSLPPAFIEKGLLGVLDSKYP
jgi:hypothetical protein